MLVDLDKLFFKLPRSFPNDSTFRSIEKKSKVTKKDLEKLLKKKEK